jgi:hypothetical protein
MKPRKWLGYNILLNDLLPDAETIIDRFEISDIPLDDTFGSSSDPLPKEHSKYILSIGPGVEVDNLNDMIELLHGIEPEFIHIETDGAYRKCLYIGSLNFDGSLIPFSSKLKDELRKLKCSPDELSKFLLNYNKLKLL